MASRSLVGTAGISSNNQTLNILLATQTGMNMTKLLEETMEKELIIKIRVVALVIY